MRLLESCTSAWPMPETQASIDALREAFSADTNQPFRLRKNFPYGSPKAPLRQSEPAESKYHPNLDPHSSHEQAVPFHYPQPLTPPMTAGLDASNSGSMNLGMLSNGHQQGLQLDDGGFDHIEWNPTRIFEYVPDTFLQDSGADKKHSQWNTAFGTSQTNTQNMMNSSQPSPPVYTPPSVASYDMSHVTESMQQQQQQFPMQSTMAPIQPVQPAPQMPSYANPTPSFVTSSMWRDTVANTYDPGGTKRLWDLESSFLADTVAPKRARGSAG